MIRPIRRRLRNHFGLTAKQVAIRSHRPWYFQSLIGLGLVLLGFGIAYWVLYDDEKEQMALRVQQLSVENIDLQKKLISAQRELQVELATSTDLAKSLSAQQDENIKLKEELVFFKNMTRKPAN